MGGLALLNCRAGERIIVTLLCKCWQWLPGVEK